MAATSNTRPPKTLILLDGGIESIIASSIIREEQAVHGEFEVLAMPFIQDLTEARAEAVIAISEYYGWQLTECLAALPTGFARSELQGETLRLIGAVLAAAHNGCERIIWPACAAAYCDNNLENNPAQDIDASRLNYIHEMAFMVTRVAGLHSDEHGLPGVRVERPLADLSSSQLAELVIDLAVDRALLWCAPMHVENSAQPDGNTPPLEDVVRGRPYMTDEERTAARREWSRWNSMHQSVM